MSKILVSLDELAAAYNQALPTLEPDEQRIAMQIYRLMAAGKPVSRKAIIKATKYSNETVNAILDKWFGVYYNDAKNIIGYWGLALDGMPHRFKVDGVTLCTWCAWDTLFIPEIIQKTAHVESTDPVSKENIRLTVTPDEIKDLEPAGAVMSYVKPEYTTIDENVIQNFCHYIFFFTSEETGAEWVSQHDNAALMSLDDAFQLAKRKNAHQYPEIFAVA